MDTGGTCKICMVTRRANQPGGVGRSVPRHRCPPLAVPCCCLVHRPDSESWHGAPPDVRGQLRSCMISERSNGSVCCNSSSKGSKGSRSSSSNNSKRQQAQQQQLRGFCEDGKRHTCPGYAKCETNMPCIADAAK